MSGLKLQKFWKSTHLKHWAQHWEILFWLYALYIFISVVSHSFLVLQFQVFVFLFSDKYNISYPPPLCLSIITLPFLVHKLSYQKYIRLSYLIFFQTQRGIIWKILIRHDQNQLRQHRIHMTLIMFNMQAALSVRKALCIY